MAKTGYMFILMKSGICRDTFIFTDRATWFVVFITRYTIGSCQVSLCYFIRKLPVHYVLICISFVNILYIMYNYIFIL